jgi:hypothetical protein
VQNQHLRAPDLKIRIPQGGSMPDEKEIREVVRKEKTIREDG